MEFFAILDAQYANRILKFNLDGAAQQKLTDIFLECYKHFLTYSEAISFNPDEELQKTECFFIDEFQSGLDFTLMKQNPEAVSELMIGKNAELQHITAVFTVHEDKLLIQNFNRRNIIDLQKSFWLNPLTPNNQFVAAEANGFSLDNKLIAIIEPDNKILFRSFNTLRHIFDMDIYFKEATDSEVNAFIGNTLCFETDENMNLIEIADTVVRTKITVINKSNILNNYSVNELKEAADSINYPLNLNGSQDKISIPNNKKQLKELLQFLSLNIYKDPITTQTRIAKSSRLYTPPTQ